SGADLAACWQPDNSRDATIAAAIFFNVTLFSLRCWYGVFIFLLGATVFHAFRIILNVCHAI
ncbi:hypothetical protein, partial [Serratia marcescens]|uniref:hypothetical protein n=1 Tax=Serratia marcescens TaxID=615 RepID=UPI001BDD4E02